MKKKFNNIFIKDDFKKNKFELSLENYFKEFYILFEKFIFKFKISNVNKIELNFLFLAEFCIILFFFNLDSTQNLIILASLAVISILVSINYNSIKEKINNLYKNI